MYTIEMVFSACNLWLKDWLEAESPILVDDWDVSNWMENEMKEATNTFLTFGFKTSKARIDALVILRSLFYEYYLFEKQIAISKLLPNYDTTVRLPALLQSQQKTSAWHAEGREMLSGHEFGPVCVGSYSEREAVLIKKCAPELIISEGMSSVESRTVYLTSEDGKLSSFKWGWRYESVARQVYETYISTLEGTAIRVFDELGRIRHPSLPRLGASPDGLIMNGSRQGRLLEIKCPITREIDNKVPIHYYCQMQLQAEVCNVDAVDYLEVQFSAFPQEGITLEMLSNGVQPWIGKICVCALAEDTPPSKYTYAYSPIFTNDAKGFQDCLAWTPEGIVLESSIWYVKNWFLTTVLRNPRWWNAVGYPSYMDFWKDVEMARSEGRHKPRALFIDSESESNEDIFDSRAGKRGDDPLSLQTVGGSDETSSTERPFAGAKTFGGWQGTE